MNVAKPDLKLDSSSVLKNVPCWIFLLGHWKQDLRIIRIARSLQVIHLTVLSILRRGGAVRDAIPHVLQSTTSSPLFSAVVQIDTLLQFLNQWRSITSNRFMLNMVKGHYLQLRCHPPLFHNLKQLKATTVHHSVIQKEAHDLLSKGVIEPLTGVGVLYSNMFVVPKHTGGYDLYLILHDSITTFTYLPLRCLLLDRYGNLFSKVIMHCLLI